MSRATIYVPKAVDDDVLDRVIGRLCDRFGGCTVRDAEGHWRAPDGDVVSEPVAEITCLSSDTSALCDNVSWSITYVYAESDESAVLGAVDGERLMYDGRFGTEYGTWRARVGGDA